MSNNDGRIFILFTSHYKALQRIVLSYTFKKTILLPIFYTIAILFLLLFFNSCTDQYSQGKRIYTTLCSNCHGEDGKGLKKLIPSLIDSKTLVDPQKMVCTIKIGINADSLDSKLSVMPSHKKIKPAEMANLINYINATFRKENKYYKVADVEKWMSDCK